MKKTVAFILAMVIALSLNGCSSESKQISLEQSRINFAQYEEQLKSLLNTYNLEWSETAHLENELEHEVLANIYRYYIIDIDDTTEIIVSFRNECIGLMNHRQETVEISYMNNYPDEFDLKLFIELVNTFSGREISKEYCETFLMKCGKGVRQRFDYLDMAGNWTISYSLYDDSMYLREIADIKFSGLTKQGTITE
ncbi:MAG: hypothetical protein IKA51_06225 [Clostridia bacterium]|nr:hypothetical protein [Clostridia bacterium]